MTNIKCSYLGDLNCEAIHVETGNIVQTDAPLDHCGKGRNFSPTDLLATSLGTCLLTIMGIKAKSNGWNLEGLNLNIEKIMTSNIQRKIKELIINIYVPENITNEIFCLLKTASNDCPVTRNLSKEINIQIIWHHGSTKVDKF